MPKPPKRNSPESNDFDVPSTHTEYEQEAAPIIAGAPEAQPPRPEPKLERVQVTAPARAQFPALPEDFRTTHALWLRVNKLPERTQQEMNEKNLLLAQVGPHWRRLQNGTGVEGATYVVPRPSESIVSELTATIRANLKTVTH